MYGSRPGYLFGMPSTDEPGTGPLIDERWVGPWLRRAALVVVLAFVCAGLVNVFGQQAGSSETTAPAADVRVEAPTRLRSGLIAEGVIRVRARERIARPRVVLGEAWADGITVNTTTPEPESEDTDGPRPVLAFSELAAGDELVLRIAFQVNPTTVGRRPQDVELRDGDRVIARVRRTLTVFP